VRNLDSLKWRQTLKNFFADFLSGLLLSCLLLIFYKSSYIFPLSVYAGSPCLSIAFEQCISSFGYFFFYPLSFFVSLGISCTLLYLRMKLLSRIYVFNIFFIFIFPLIMFLHLFSYFVPFNLLFVVASSFLAIIPLAISGYLFVKTDSNPF